MPPRPLFFFVYFYWFIIGCSRDYGLFTFIETLGYFRVLYGLFRGSKSLEHLQFESTESKNNWESSRKSCPRDLWFFIYFYWFIIGCSRDLDEYYFGSIIWGSVNLSNIFSLNLLKVKNTAIIRGCLILRDRTLENCII